MKAVVLRGKGSWRVKRNQFIGGIVLLVLAAAIFLFLKTSASVPVAITLTVVGVALVAVSRRKQRAPAPQSITTPRGPHMRGPLRVLTACG